MMKRDWDLLFSKYDLHAVLENTKARVSETVLRIAQELFKNETDDLLAASAASELVVSPLEVLADQVSVSAVDAKIDVSQAIHLRPLRALLCRWA
jgi:hypothetical protein